MSSLKCHPDDVRFKFKENADLLASPFFKTTFASDWCSKNYSDWLGKKASGRLYDEYRTDLVKIMACSDSPHTIKGFVGRLLDTKGEYYDEEPVKTTTIYNDSISIVGCHNNTLIHTHQQGQSSVSSSDESTATSTSQLSLSLQAPHGTPFIVDRVDISERFYRLQQYVFDFLKTNDLTVESDSHLILSLSSILLLQNNNRLNHAMIPFFGDKLYSKIRKHNLDKWNMTHKFPGDVLLASILIAENLYDETTDRINACASLLLLANTIDDPIDKRLLVSASQLLQLLPVDATNIEISETTFITRHILPALQPLFDNQERNIRFEYSSTDLADNHKRPPGFNGCPDCTITIFRHQTDDGVNVRFGEVKRQSMAGNHYLVNWDLLRLAVFGKNAIDGNKLSGNLAIHVVGSYITFYLIKLHADGLYIMTELARLQSPMSVVEVPAYLTNFRTDGDVIGAMPCYLIYILWENDNDLWFIANFCMLMGSLVGKWVKSVDGLDSVDYITLWSRFDDCFEGNYTKLGVKTDESSQNMLPRRKAPGIDSITTEILGPISDLVSSLLSSAPSSPYAGIGATL
ncbi:hypothetical protein [Absidia glauca]|uniref:Uncharacterized protein n=1 Tax=Absidia glauca TaxID=4829 RepID=A0A168N4H2_ABSGL|nr:hypothetical protein [Absidia glauca]